MHEVSDPAVGQSEFGSGAASQIRRGLRSSLYLSAANTFDCFYRKVEGNDQGCEHAKKIADVFGADSYAKMYTCQKLGNGDDSLQVGSDPAIKIFITYEKAPLETSLIDINGVPTAINGPYRNLPEPPTVKPGREFDCYRIDGIVQSKRILQANRDAP